MNLPLISQYDERIRTECAPFDFEKGYKLEDGTVLDSQKIFELLKGTMCDHRGIGLAAPQLGIMARVFVMGMPDDPDSVIPVFNPRIVNYSDDIEDYEEGCLTFPGLFIHVKRPRTIRVRYANVAGEVNTINFDGLTARIFQHEYDHLNGIIYKKRATRSAIERGYKQQKKLNRMKKRNAAKF